MHCDSRLTENQIRVIRSSQVIPESHYRHLWERGRSLKYFLAPFCQPLYTPPIFAHVRIGSKAKESMIEIFMVALTSNKLHESG
jgi:hypothetical protein